MTLLAKSRSPCRALTAVEVLLVVATVALLAVVALPMFARAKVRTKRIPCTSNLKQVGIAYRLWSNDHEDKFPFASTNALSSLCFVDSPQVFRHYEVMSNELVTPKVLTCFSDTKRKQVADFTKLSNANLSYFVGLDAREDNPHLILSGDRNITGGTLSNGFLRVLKPDNTAAWTGEIHVNAGNIGLADGSAQQATTPNLQKQLQNGGLSVIRLAVP
jgi:Tfp pilus assembly protein PilE